MGQRLSNALGLCRKAGRCVTGDETVEKTVRAGKALLVVLDEEASENTRDKYTFLCRGRGVELLLVKEPGRAIGQPGKKLIAVTDTGFAKMIQEANKFENECGGK